MFKKTTAIFLALTLILSFAGCAQDNTETTDDPSSSSTQSTSAPETNATEADAVDKIGAVNEIDTDENLLTVEITIPAELFAEQDMENFDPDAYASEQGFISAKVNDDKSVTITMSKAKHNQILDEYRKSIAAAIAEFVNGEDTPYIKEITHDDDFTTVTIKVDREAYENAFDLTPFAIGIYAKTYQVYTEIEFHVDITIVDAENGDTIDTVSYPLEE